MPLRTGANSKLKSLPLFPRQEPSPQPAIPMDAAKPNSISVAETDLIQDQASGAGKITATLEKALAAGTTVAVRLRDGSVVYYSGLTDFRAHLARVAGESR